MGLFSRNYEKPGPGVSKDEPRKKGAARFFELLFRDFADYIKLSFLFCLCVLPSAIMFVIGALPYIVAYFQILIGASSEVEVVSRGLFVLPLLLSLVLAFPIGGAWVACFFNITRFMRDEPSFLWHEFKRKFKENYKQAAPTGIVCTAYIYMQLLFWMQFITGVYTGGLILVALSLMSLVLFSMITPYIFLHYAYLDLKTSQVLRNSFLISLAKLPRSFAGAVLGNVIWVLILLFMPQSITILPMIPIILTALSMLMALTWIWPPFDKYFKIEEKLREKKEEKTSTQA